MSAIAEVTQAARDRTDLMVHGYRAAEVNRHSMMAGGGVVLGEGQLSAAVFGEGSADRELYSHYRGWTYSAVRPIAETIAGQAVHVGREVAPRDNVRGRRLSKHGRPRHLKSVEIDEYERHPLLEAIDYPNPLMVDWHLLYILVASLEIVGQHHWWVVPGKDRPVIWPIPASWIQPIHEEGKPFRAWAITPGGQGEPETVPAEEVVYFYYPNIASPTGSTSPAQTQGRAVAADEAMQDAQAQTFRNGVFPKHALIVGDITEEDENLGRPVLEHEQRQQLYAEFKKLYSDVQQYGLPIILDRLITDIKPLGHKPEEMDYLNSGKSTKARITQGHGTNPVIMGEIEGVNRASSFVARRHFAEHTVNPKIEMISKTLTRTFAPLLAEEGERLHVWIEPYQPDDRDERRRDLDLAAKFGCVTKDEVRGSLEHLSLEPMDEGGDDLAAASSTGPVVPTVERIQTVPKALPDLREAIDRDEWTKRWLKAHSVQEDKLADVVHELFLEQRDDVTVRLYELLGEVKRKGVHSQEGLSELIFNPDEWEERLIDACRPAILHAAYFGAIQAKVKATKAGPTVEELMVQLTPKVRGAIDAEVDTILGRPYWLDVQQTTRMQLSATLSEGMANGESMHLLAARIGDAPTVPVPDPGVFPPGTNFGSNAVLGSQSSRRRAILIARTETTGALNAGQYMQQEEMVAEGITDGMEWMTLIDNYTRGSHAGLNGARAPGDYPVGQWNIGGHIAPYPGHHSLPTAERCNCRCTLAPVVEVKLWPSR